MSKPIVKRKARRLAFDNAASLIESMDQDQLFGDIVNEEDLDSDVTAERLDDAQRAVVAYLRKAIKHESKA